MLNKFSLGYSYERNKKLQRDKARREELIRKSMMEHEKKNVLSEHIVEYLLSVGKYCFTKALVLIK